MSGIGFYDPDTIPRDNKGFTRWCREHLLRFFNVRGKEYAELFGTHELAHKRPVQTHILSITAVRLAPAVSLPCVERASRAGKQASVASAANSRIQQHFEGDSHELADRTDVVVPWQDAGASDACPAPALRGAALPGHHADRDDPYGTQTDPVVADAVLLPHACFGTVADIPACMNPGAVKPIRTGDEGMESRRRSGNVRGCRQGRKDQVPVRSTAASFLSCSARRPSKFST
jgi:hypothetical protein